MKLLLDTQIFIWWDSKADKLPATILQMCEDKANILVLSVTSIWEMQIKAQLGKLTLDRPLQQIVSEQQASNQLQILPVEATHVFGLQALPMHHKDPFDRMLIAQAMAEDFTILSVDAAFERYPVRLNSA